MEACMRQAAAAVGGLPPMGCVAASLRQQVPSAPGPFTQRQGSTPSKQVTPLKQGTQGAWASEQPASSLLSRNRGGLGPSANASASASFTASASATGSGSASCVTGGNRVTGSVDGRRGVAAESRGIGTSRVLSLDTATGRVLSLDTVTGRVLSLDTVTGRGVGAGRGRESKGGVWVASGNGYAGPYPRPVSAPGTLQETAGRSGPQFHQRQLPGEDWLPEKSGQPGGKLKLFSGTGNRGLAQEIAACIGLELGKIQIKRFADGEIYVQVQESVRGCDVFLIQPTCPPANENLMELLIMIDACRRASAKTITAVIPYFGYARADRKTQGRESIAAKLVANLITEAGADRVLACDLHSGQSVGYFDIPVDQVYGQSVILDYLASKMMPKSQELVVVSPDVGGVARARAFAKKLSDSPLAIVDKRRQGHNIAEVMNLIGDVNGKVAIMVDDMIDTAGTIYKGASLLREAGAAQVYACCTHAVFSPPAVERLSSGLFEEVITTNTIALPPDRTFPQLTILSMANLLGEAIWRIHDESCGHPSAAAMEID